jgi:hypothetical protein
MIHFRLEPQLPDQDTELARKVTVLKSAFTTDHVGILMFAIRPAFATLSLRLDTLRADY